MAIPYCRILVPLDGSEFAAKALPHAEAVARSMTAELILLQVLPVSDIPASDPTISPVDAESMDLYVDHHQSEQMQSVLVGNAHESLLKTIEVSIGEDVDVRPVVEIGSPTGVIIDYVRDNNIDLVVMSTHARIGLPRWVFGSVAIKVLQAAPCPVLLIRVTG